MSKFVNCFIYAIRYVMGAMRVKYDSFIEPKNDEKWQYKFWLSHLLALVNYESPDARTRRYGKKLLKELEPSEYFFLTEIRQSVLNIYDFNLSQERLLYKTLFSLIK